MSNLNAHIKKSHGLSWKEAEQKYGISAKTGESIVTSNKPWEHPLPSHDPDPSQREGKLSDLADRIEVHKLEYRGMIGHSVNQ